MFERVAGLVQLLRPDLFILFHLLGRFCYTGVLLLFAEMMKCDVLELLVGAAPGPGEKMLAERRIAQSEKSAINDHLRSSIEGPKVSEIC